MKYGIEVQSEVGVNDMFPATCVAYNDEAESRKINSFAIYCQPRAGGAGNFTVASTATTDIDDPDPNMITWQVAGNQAEYPPSGTAGARTIEAGETGRITFDLAIHATGEHYVHILARVANKDTSKIWQQVQVARIKVNA